jgi:hypothetical protein
MIVLNVNQYNVIIARNGKLEMKSWNVGLRYSDSWRRTRNSELASKLLDYDRCSCRITNAFQFSISKVKAIHTQISDSTRHSLYHLVYTSFQITNVIKIINKALYCLCDLSGSLVSIGVSSAPALCLLRAVTPAMRHSETKVSSHRLHSHFSNR